MITWTERLAFVGMIVEVESASLHHCKVRVRIPDGLCSFGEGNTFEGAIRNAAWGMGIDWGSVERKITERAWERMSHL